VQEAAVVDVSRRRGASDIERARVAHANFRDLHVDSGDRPSDGHAVDRARSGRLGVELPRLGARPRNLEPFSWLWSLAEMAARGRTAEEGYVDAADARAGGLAIVIREVAGYHRRVRLA